MINIVITTTDEITRAAIEALREHSRAVRRLADLEQTPLGPGETEDTRRHRIASAGLKLANAWAVLEAMIEATMPEVSESEPAPESPARDIDPNAN